MRSRLLEVLDPLGHANFLDCSDKSLLANVFPADWNIFFLFLSQPDKLLVGTWCLAAMYSRGFFILIFVTSSKSRKITAFVSSSHCLRLSAPRVSFSPLSSFLRFAFLRRSGESHFGEMAGLLGLLFGVPWVLLPGVLWGTNATALRQKNKNIYIYI